jgi:hypothetical protein
VRRILLLGVATLLSASALLAVAILLFGGEFGRTQGRIVGTTALLAGYGVAVIPAATLFDRAVAPALAWLDAGLGAVAAALALAAIWGADGETLGKLVGSLTVTLLAVSQTALLVARRGEGEPRLLFPLSIVLAGVAAALAWVLFWAVEDNAGFARVLAAVVVLDLLAAALQPILARARTAERTRLRLHLASGDVRELSVRGRVDRVDVLP